VYNDLIIKNMGKGDKKTKRGKILMGSHGVRRPRRKHVRNVPLAALKEEKPIETIKEKTAGKAKPVTKEVPVEKPVISAPVEESAKPAEVAAEEAVKPARKKSPPKGSAKKEAK
jgi:30S ribosomal protein S31